RKTATIIKATMPRRSIHGARLKSSHHTTISSAHAAPPSIAIAALSGLTAGTTSLRKSRSSAAATPGHNRSGFRGATSPACAFVTDSAELLGFAMVVEDLRL